MISDTLKGFIGKYVTIRTVASYNAFGGVLEDVKDDHIVLRNNQDFVKKYGNNKILVPINQITSILYDYIKESEIEVKNGSTEGRQNLVKLSK